jgi:hypothetical protein
VCPAADLQRHKVAEPWPMVWHADRVCLGTELSTTVSDSRPAMQVGAGPNGSATVRTSHHTDRTQVVSLRTLCGSSGASPYQSCKKDPEPRLTQIRTTRPFFLMKNSLSCFWILRPLSSCWSSSRWNS